MGPRDDLYPEQDKISFICLSSNRNWPVVQPVAYSVSQLML